MVASGFGGRRSRTGKERRGVTGPDTIRREGQWNRGRTFLIRELRLGCGSEASGVGGSEFIVGGSHLLGSWNLVESCRVLSSLVESCRVLSSLVESC
jgi:hypothetical protein